MTGLETVMAAAAAEAITVKTVLSPAETMLRLPVTIRLHSVKTPAQPARARSRWARMPRRRLQMQWCWVKTRLPTAIIRYRSARKDAIAGLPQATAPGKSMVAVSSGLYRRESAIALGISTVTEDNSWVFKLSGSAN